MLDHRKIVGDEDVCEVALLPGIQEHVQHLRLDRHIERGDRFVGNQEFGIGDQRAGDRDALALAAGEFVRQPPTPLRIVTHRDHDCLDKIAHFGVAELRTVEA